MFPLHYKMNISESTLPAELMKEYTTMEYILPNVELRPKIYLFIIDTCCGHDELKTLKSELTRNVEQLDKNTQIGIITIGKHAFLYNLG